jgi:hypothetical protein
MIDNLQFGVQSAHSRASVLRFLLAGMLALHVIGIGSGFAQHALLSDVQAGAQLTTEQASANDTREQAIAILTLIVFIVTAIVWLFWQHRAYSNLRLIGARDTELTPGWSVGYWFIPIINLVKPYQVTAELYRRSELQNRRDPIGGLSGPSLVGWWWFAYLSMNVLGRIYATMVKTAKTLPALVSATSLSIVQDVVAVIACIVAIMVVRSIDRFQQEFSVTDQIAAT